MKRLLILAVALTSYAQTITIKESPDQSRFYTIAPPNESVSAKSAASKRLKNRYYLFGDPSLERVSMGEIIVSFAKETDITAFGERYHLKNPRRISVKFHSWIFENASELDDLSLAAQIGANEPNIRYAKPNWLSTAITQ
ncbi:MAG: hypothetical protein LBI57_07780 [Helicobacteraceae bacterium]|nr:hypothetical protein [Helicobacteraceae bacterium]